MHDQMAWRALGDHGHVDQEASSWSVESAFEPGCRVCAASSALGVGKMRVRERFVSALPPGLRRPRALQAANAASNGARPSPALSRSVSNVRPGAARIADTRTATSPSGTRAHGRWETGAGDAGSGRSRRVKSSCANWHAAFWSGRPVPGRVETSGGPPGFFRLPPQYGSQGRRRRYTFGSKKVRKSAKRG